MSRSDHLSTGLVLVREPEPRPAYIAAPYAAATPELIQRNVQRALCVARLAQLAGRAPIVPHPGSHLVFGTDDEIRDRALACCLATVGMVARAGGEFWVLRQEDGTLSTGCELELQHYLNSADERSLVVHLVKPDGELPAVTRHYDINRELWLAPWGGQIP